MLYRPACRTSPGLRRGADRFVSGRRGLVYGTGKSFELGQRQAVPRGRCLTQVAKALGQRLCVCVCRRAMQSINPLCLLQLQKNQFHCACAAAQSIIRGENGLGECLLCDSKRLEAILVHMASEQSCQLPHFSRFDLIGPGKIL